MAAESSQDEEWLAQRFSEQRERLTAVAYRVLGSHHEAEDAVQEVWLRMSRADTASVENLNAWMTTVVARVALDMLRARKARGGEQYEDWAEEEFAESTPDRAASSNPESEALLADAMGPALLLLLDSLTPSERLAFVLHDLFSVPFEEIAPIVERTPEATRQLASRARRRVRGLDPDAPSEEAASDQARIARQRVMVNAFLRAARFGDFNALLNILAPSMQMRGDAAAVAMGGVALVDGRQAVAEFFRDGGAAAVRPALLNGEAGAVFAMGKNVKVMFNFTFVGDQIAAIDLVANEEAISSTQIEIFRRED